MKRHAQAIGVQWLRAIPAAVLFVSAATLGQVAGGLNHPAPSQLVTDPAPTDLTPAK